MECSNGGLAGRVAVFAGWLGCRIIKRTEGTFPNSGLHTSQMFKKIIGGNHAFKKGNKFMVIKMFRFGAWYAA